MVLSFDQWASAPYAARTVRVRYVRVTDGLRTLWDVEAVRGYPLPDDVREKLLAMTPPRHDTLEMYAEPGSDLYDLDVLQDRLDAEGVKPDPKKIEAERLARAQRRFREAGAPTARDVLVYCRRWAEATKSALRFGLIEGRPWVTIVVTGVDGSEPRADWLEATLIEELRPRVPTHLYPGIATVSRTQAASPLSDPETLRHAATVYPDEVRCNAIVALYAVRDPAWWESVEPLLRASR